MMMKGDMQKVIDQVNPVFETAFKRIEELEKRIKALEEAAKPPKKVAAKAA